MGFELKPLSHSTSGYRTKFFGDAQHSQSTEIPRSPRSEANKIQELFDTERYKAAGLAALELIHTLLESQHLDYRVYAIAGYCLQFYHLTLNDVSEALHDSRFATASRYYQAVLQAKPNYIIAGKKVSLLQEMVDDTPLPSLG